MAFDRKKGRGQGSGLDAAGGGQRQLAPGRRTLTQGLQRQRRGSGRQRPPEGDRIESASQPMFRDLMEGASSRPTRAQLLGDEGGDAVETEPRGGTTHVIARGETLTGIAAQIYGRGRYWRDIMRANPDKVSRGGDLIVAGDELELPVVQVPVERTSDSPEEPEPEPGPAPDPVVASGGDELVCEPAELPRAVSTEYGDFLLYPDEYPGPLPPGEDGEEPLRESELEPTVAVREGQAKFERSLIVSQVNSLLEYGAFDWAITDSDAAQALQQLGSIEPLSQLEAAVRSIDAERLLDNLADEARRTPEFARVVVAMGPAAYRPLLDELLSYGVFDWAIRDADVQIIIDIFSVLPADQQVTFLGSLNSEQLSRLARNLSDDVEAPNEVLKLLFDTSPDSDLDALTALFERRFQIDLSTWFVRRWQMDIEEEWDAPGLRRLWTLFEQLPPGHIEDNERLDDFLRASQDDGSGVYYGGHDAGVVSYGDVNARGGYGNIMVDDGAGRRNVALNTNVNLFNTVVRHEVGHAVDAEIGASDDGGYATTADNAGAWRTYGSTDEFVDAIIAAGGGMSGHGYPDEDAYRQAMRRAVSEGEDFVDALAEIDSSVDAPDASVTGPVAAVYETSRWHPDANPWYDSPDRQDVGGRLWQRPYGSGNYVSFLKAARTSHGVSSYQFRAPGEWFAEAYAAYYSDHDGRGGKPVGTRLRTRDPASADWFDANVDQGHSLPRETGQADESKGRGGRR